jgi:apolipoprotein D and lipocalin family protein
LELDENYQYALIGSNSSKYLWILSRTPEIDDKLYNSILEKATKGAMM